MDKANNLRFECMLRRIGLTNVSRPVLVGVVFICILLVIIGLWRFWPSASADSSSFQVVSDSSGSSADVADSNKSNNEGDLQSTTTFYVDVEGAVAAPGVYEVASNARVVDAIQEAGGLLDDAQRESINLAAQLEDGMQIYVPSTEEQENASSSTSSSSASSSSASAVGSSQGASGVSGKININTASAEELQELSGIGPALSERIVEYRETNGRFSSVEELKEVSGIGDTRYESLKDAVCV